MDRTKPVTEGAGGRGAASGFSPAGHGTVYTRPWAVELVLDLAGYDAAKNIVDAIAVEPACGDGEFLEPMIRRLSASCRRQGRPLKDCVNSIAAYDVNPKAVAAGTQRALSFPQRTRMQRFINRLKTCPLEDSEPL